MAGRDGGRTAGRAARQPVGRRAKRGPWGRGQWGDGHRGGNDPICGQVSRSGCVDSQQREKDVLSTCARRTEAGRKVETADRSSIVPRRWTPSAVIGMRRRAQVLAGRTRRPGVAVAEGSGSSERRRRRVVAAVAARATCIDGLLREGGAPMRLARRQSIRIELCWHLWWGRPLSSAKSRRARELILGVSYTTEINFYVER